MLGMLPCLNKSDFLYIVSQQISVCSNLVFNLHRLDDDLFALIMGQLSFHPSVSVRKKPEESQDKENQHGRNGRDNDRANLHASFKSGHSSSQNAVTDDQQEGRSPTPIDSERSIRPNLLNLEDLSSHYYNWSRKNSEVRSIRQDMLVNEEPLNIHEACNAHQDLALKRQHFS